MQPTISEVLERYGWGYAVITPITEESEKAWQVSRQRAQAIMSRATSAANKEQHQTKRTRK